MDSNDFTQKIRSEKRCMTYAALEAQYHVNRWYLWQFINRDGYEPPPKIAAALGIQLYKPAPVCLKCGVVHVTKRCTATPRRYRDLLDVPRAELRQWIEKRVEI